MCLAGRDMPVRNQRFQGFEWAYWGDLSHKLSGIMVVCFTVAVTHAGQQDVRFGERRKTCLRRIVISSPSVSPLNILRGGPVFVCVCLWTSGWTPRSSRTSTYPSDRGGSLVQMPPMSLCVYQKQTQKRRKKKKCRQH